MVRKQQLASAAQDSEPLRSSNQQLRASLGQAQDTITQLQERLREESAARSAALNAKAAAEERALDLQKERDHWKVRQPCWAGGSTAAGRSSPWGRGLGWPVTGGQCRAFGCMGAALHSRHTAWGSFQVPGCCCILHAITVPRLAPCVLLGAALLSGASCSSSCCGAQSEYNSQKQIMEAQRDLLEQQQAVLRKLAAHKQAQLSGGQPKSDTPQA